MTYGLVAFRGKCCGIKFSHIKILVNKFFEDCKTANFVDNILQKLLKWEIHESFLMKN